MHPLSAGRAPSARLRRALKPPGDLQPADLVLLTGSELGGELAARLRAESERKDAFLAMVAHELRNCMAPLANAVELLVARGEEPALAAPAAATAQRQLDAMNRLVHDLLDVARVLRDQIELAPEPCSLQALVGEVVQTCRPVLEGVGRDLSLFVTDEPLRVVVDRVRFWQMLSNLLDNAAKFTQVHGRITVGASREGDVARISVSDDGAGIAAEELGRMFDLVREDRHTCARAGGGLGIGLALVQRLAALHGGTVEAASAGAGQGATFTIRLPLA